MNRKFTHIVSMVSLKQDSPNSHAHSKELSNYMFHQCNGVAQSV